MCQSNLCRTVGTQDARYEEKECELGEGHVPSSFLAIFQSNQVVHRPFIFRLVWRPRGIQRDPDSASAARATIL